MWRITRARNAARTIIFAVMIAFLAFASANTVSAAQLSPGSSASLALRAAPAAATGDCAFEWPNDLGNCTSPDPAVKVESLSEGDTSGCSFSGTVDWGDSSTENFSFSGAPDGTVFDFANHTYKAAGTYSISVANEVITGPCVWGDFTVSFTYQSSTCTRNYSQPSSWDTAEAVSDTPGIANYIEPLNVVISACSNVSLSDIRTALGDWSTVSSSTTVDLDGVHFKCISPESADVAGHGYVTQQQAWRYEGCAEGNVLSLTGLENHVRIWNQPAAGSQYGAWFITASYETACVSIKGKLYSFFDEGSHLQSGMHFFHCVDGGPGSFDTNGYNRAAKDFAHEIVLAAQQKGWKATEETVSRPIGSSQDTGEDGVKFNGTVYVLTVTQ